MTQYRKPPTLDEAYERELVTEQGKGVHSFSNGSEWDSWASDNCHRCRFYDPKVMGASCALEGAAFMGVLSPKLATLFGWTQDAKYDKPDDHRHGWDYPDRCAFFNDDSDDDRRVPPAPFVDPTQLVFGGIDPLFPIVTPAPSRPEPAHV